MARIMVQGSQVIFHSSPKSPLTEIASVEAVTNFWKYSGWRGVRAPGTGIPKVAGLGTWRKLGAKTFCAVYKDEPGYKVIFKSGEFEAWLVSTPELPSDLAKFLKSS